MLGNIPKLQHFVFPVVGSSSPQLPPSRGFENLRDVFCSHNEVEKSYWLLLGMPRNAKYLAIQSRELNCPSKPKPKPNQINKKYLQQPTSLKLPLIKEIKDICSRYDSHFPTSNLHSFQAYSSRIVLSTPFQFRHSLWFGSATGM